MKYGPHNGACYSNVPLIATIFSGTTEYIKLLLEQGGRINSRSGDISSVTIAFF